MAPLKLSDMQFKKLREITIYQKIFWLIILSGVFFFSLYFSVYYYTDQQEKSVYDTSRKHFDNEVDSVIELNAQTNISNIIDIVYWDEFVNYLNTRSKHWFEENIISSLDTYKADYLGIYDVQGNFISKSANKNIRSTDFIPKQIFKRLEKERLVKFYARIPEGYVQIFGASVHPTKDIYLKTSKPEGFFFIVKLLNKQYFSDLEKINNSRIGFLNPAFKSTNKSIFSIKELKGWDGKTIRKLIFSRPFDVSFHTTKRILVILIISYFLSVLIYLWYSRQWIYKPLSLITSILEKGNENDMNSLKDIPGEFKYMGKLFKENDKQRKMLEAAKVKAEESDRLKSSFLTNISHEIRTPMNAIVGFSDLLAHTKLSDSEKLEYAMIINKSGANLVSIIDDLIEMSKIDTNQVAPNYSAVNIDSCLNELHKTINIGISNENIDFHIRKPINRLFGNVITDEVKLKQVLTNLINNAIKYTESGFVIFGYEVNASLAEIEFTVQDSGIGIDAEHHKNIFDRFHRIENDVTIKAGGLGLGLAISKAYVQMMGGRITIESEESKGTTVSFTIPLRSGNSIKLKRAIVHEPSITPERKMTILVAEDDNINFLLIQKMLNQDNHLIIRAKNGQEAVDMCKENKAIDLVLMDIKMPVMGGYEAFEHIRVFRPDLPVIAQTAYASSEDERKILDSGFRGYISKPINKEKLFEIIDNTIKLKFNS